MYDLLTLLARCFVTGNSLLLRSRIAGVCCAAVFSGSLLFSQPTPERYVRFCYDDARACSYAGRLDSLAAQAAIRRQLTALQTAGYTGASVDTVQFSRDTCTAWFFRGEKYVIDDIRLTAEQVSLLEEAGLLIQRMKNKPFDSLSTRRVVTTALRHLVNNGYPFATVSLQNSRFDRDRFSAALQLDKGPYIVYDTIICEGTLALPPRFLRRYTQMLPGTPYSQEKLTLAERKIKELPYCQLLMPPAVRFHGGEADIVLALERKRANRFDFLIGILPQPGNASSSLILTGDFLAEAHNLLQYGEYSFIQMKRINPGSLELVLKSTIPYFGDFPLGSYLDFRMFKNKNLTLDLHLDAGAQFSFLSGAQWKLYGSFRSSSLIDINSQTIATAGRLPARLDTRYRGLGISVSDNRTDNRFAPYRGIQFEAHGNLGVRSILPNRQINSLEGFSGSYDSLALASFQADLSAAVHYFQPVSKRITSRFAVQGAIKYTESGLLTNELRRLGGNRTLRGYDEESLFTDRYIYATTELRFLLEESSFFTFPFVDAGIVHLPDNAGGRSVFVLGAGAGLHFSTPAGVFNIAVALGNQQGFPLTVSAAKIHFGFVNVF